MPISLDLSILRSRKALKRIAVVTGVFAMLGLGYGFIAPKWYRSVLTVVPAKPPKAGVSGLLGAELAGLASGLDVSGAGADAPRIAAVLQSIAVSDAVIGKFDLRARYGVRYQETAREALWRHCAVKTLAKPNLVQLSCEDKDPQFVREMLAYFAEYGNDVFRRISVSSASEEVRFLEKRVAELRQQASASAERMREFQERHKIVDLESQAKAVVASIATLNSERIAKQLELEFARTFSSGDESTTRLLRSQLSVIGNKLRDLEEPTAAVPLDAPTDAPLAAPGGKGRQPNATGVFPAALSVPRLRAEFEALYRERKVAEATLIVALERLESAKANEARDTSSFLVLDPPALPTKSSRPSRANVLIMVTLLGAALGVAYEWWRKAGGGRAVLARVLPPDGTPGATHARDAAARGTGS